MKRWAHVIGLSCLAQEWMVTTLKAIVSFFLGYFVKLAPKIPVLEAANFGLVGVFTLD